MMMMFLCESLVLRSYAHLSVRGVNAHCARVPVCRSRTKSSCRWLSVATCALCTSTCLLQSYDEFMSLAEHGNMRTVHEYMSDHTDGLDSNEDNFYVKLLDRKTDDFEEPVILFGKCVDKQLSKCVDK